MINIGTCLHKPFQSIDSKFRCLLILNPGRSRNEISQQIKAEIPFTFRSGDALTNNFNRLMKTKTGEETVKINDKVESYKNCLTCASRAYHSEVYNFTWLEKCPLHPDEALRTYCKSCGKSFFSLPVGKKNSCKSCEDLSLKLLIKHGAFDESTDFSLLAKLVDLLINFDTDQRYRLHTGLSHSEPVCTLKSSDPHFPSVLATITPDHVNLFRKAKVHMQACKIEQATLGDKVDFEPTLSWSKFAIRREAWTTNVDNRVAKLILNRLLPLHSCADELHDEWRVCARRNLCPYCMAFDTWLYFLKEERTDNVKRIDIASFNLNRFYLSNVVQRPEPLRFMWPTKKEDTDYDLPRDAYVTPRNIQEAIYEQQLWIAFLNTIEIVKLALLRTDNFQNSYPTSLPQLELKTASFHINVEPDGTVRLTLPTAGFGRIQ